MSEILINLNLNIPNHASKLKQAEEKIKNLRKEIDYIKSNSTITDKKHTDLYEEVVHALDRVGRLSNSVFDIRDELEQRYKTAYVKATRLGFTLFEEHYSKLHHPYSLLKNRCFTLLEELDKVYIKKFKKYPPNWEI